MEKGFYQILIQESTIQIPKSLLKTYKKAIIRRNSNPIIMAKQKFNSCSTLSRKK